MSNLDSTRDGLFEKRVVPILGEITREKCTEIHVALLNMNLRSPDETIHLLIDSPGGEVEPSLWLSDQIRLMPAPVTAIIAGMCGSSAFYPMLVADKRFATTNSEFHLHYTVGRVSYDIETIENEEYWKLIFEGYRDLFKSVLRLHAHYSDLTTAAIKRLMKNGGEAGINLSAKQALEYGFIDKVVDGYEGLF